LPPPTRDPRLWALAAGNFAVGTGALVVAGLLPLMARDLATSVGAMGQTLTAFALAVAIGGPLLAGLTSQVDRRLLLMIALAVFALGNVACAMAGSYETLMAARVLTGIGASMFTPHATGAAALMVTPQARGRAISLVFIGFTASTVAGIPLGTYLGDWLGWRTTLLAIAACALAALLGVGWRLPAGLKGIALDTQAWRAVFTSKVIVLTLAVTVVQALGQFIAFTYLAAYFEQAGAATAGLAGLFFALYGIAGIAGNVLGGWWIDTIGPARVVERMLVGSALGMALLSLAGLGVAAAATAMLVWGFGAFAINGAQQPRMIALAPRYATATLPLNSSSIYIGQAMGALLGAGLIAGPGYVWLGPAGAMVLLAAFVISRRAANLALAPSA
jgi:predicted MFS family arabinose efflux permease